MQIADFRWPERCHDFDNDNVNRIFGNNIIFIIVDFVVSPRSLNSAFNLYSLRFQQLYQIAFYQRFNQFPPLRSEKSVELSDFFISFLKHFVRFLKLLSKNPVSILKHKLYFFNSQRLSIRFCGFFHPIVFHPNYFKCEFTINMLP